MALDAHFLVDATGWQARVALRLGASRRSHDRLTFVAGFFAPGAFAGAPALTMLEAVPYGWWYAARLPDGRLVAAVGSDADRIRHAALHRPDRFRTHLVETRHIGRLFRGASCPDGPLVVYSAPSSRLDRVAGPGWLAVGDAASAFDPISSQGITKALSDGLGAGAAISGWLAGDAAALETYSASVAARFEEYLQTRAYLYAIEQRWADAPFWRRRRARSGLLAA
jgi:flavin-dependent dehydrogenase